MTASTPSISGPLGGLLVADFTRAVAGPYATMLLGDLGARVVKVERPDGGDESRGWGPPWSHGLSTYYQSVNRNKRSATCDLATPDGRAAALELCLRADVVVQNFQRGTMDRFGLGAEELVRRRPRLVYCSITGFGPSADLPGYDFLVQAVGGLMSITGVENGEPLRVGVPIVDVLTGLHATVGILAALRHRDATGLGQHVEVNLMASLLSGLVNQVSAHLNAGVVPRALGNRHPSIAPYEVLRARDRPLAVAVANDRQFAALSEELQVEELARDPRFKTNAARVDNRDELEARLNAALRSADAAEWIARLTPRGVPCGVVNRVDEAVSYAEGLGLEPSVDLTDEVGRSSRQVRHPISFSATPATYRDAPMRWDQVAGLAEVLETLDEPWPMNNR